MGEGILLRVLIRHTRQKISTKPFKQLKTVMDGWKKKKVERSKTFLSLNKVPIVFTRHYRDTEERWNMHFLIVLIIFFN